MSQVQTVASADASKAPFKKREIYIDCTRYDPYTGERSQYENKPLLEFGGDRVLEKLEALQLKAGDIVTVSFDIQGTPYKDKDGKQVSDRILSAEEYTALSKAQGRKQKELVESILGNSAYASLTDAQKAAAIDYAYAYAKDYARGEVLEDHPGITTKWMAQIRGDVAEGILRQVAVGTTGKYTELPIEKASFVDELLSGLWDKPREDKPDGGKYTSVRQIQQIEAIVAADSELTEKQQKLVLQDILDEKAFAKYEKVTALGYDNDAFAEIYRLCLDTEGGKADTIRALMRQQGISYAAAKQLYEIYSKSKDTK